MPLTQGDIVRYDAGSLFYKFRMMNGLHAVDCEISSAALRDIVGGQWATLQILDREAQFLKYRDQIERIASDLYDAATLPKPSLVRIFAKHLPRDKSSLRTPC